MRERLISRVGRIISGGFNALVDAVENAAPEAVMEEAIREVDDAIDEIRAELGKVVARKHLATSKLMEENKQHEVKNHPLVSAIANSALRTHNVPTHGKYIQADYHSQRNVFRSPFNLMSHSLADGMMHIVPGSFVQSIMGVNKDSKKAKKEKKHAKKHRKN